MKKDYLTEKELQKLLSRGDLNKEQIKAVIHELETKGIEITLTAIIETLAILWGFDFFDED